MKSHRERSTSNKKNLDKTLTSLLKTEFSPSRLIPSVIEPFEEVQRALGVRSEVGRSDVTQVLSFLPHAAEMPQRSQHTTQVRFYGRFL